MMSLYSVADGQFTLANRNLVINALPKVPRATEAELQWAADAHGTGVDRASLPEAYFFASRLLVCLLRKMVELGRVP